MAEKINLRSSKVKEQKRRVADYGTETPLSSTAVERGTTRWLDGSTVFIEGLLDITGTTSISGLLNVSGQTTLSGATTITGPTGITGKLTIQGETDITGKTTISNDLELLSGGIFKAGETEIEPSGKATFGKVIIDPSSLYLLKTPGGFISGDGSDDITLGSNISSSASLNHERAELNFKGDYVRVNASGTAISKALRINTGTTYFEVSQGKLRCTALPTTGLAPNVYMDGSGNFYRSTFSVPAA